MARVTVGGLGLAGGYGDGLGLGMERGRGQSGRQGLAEAGEQAENICPAGV